MSTVKLVLNGVNDDLELTQYLDVEAGRGMEPGDPHFTNKVFAHSLLKPGGTFALEDLQLKELVFPLKLVTKTKPELAALVQRINKILTTPGTQVEWQDEGATGVTYFDLASGQFDDEYDYRIGVNNWLKGKLRLFTQPLGFNEAARVGASQKIAGKATIVAAGSNPIVSFPVATAVAGDAAALLNGAVAGPSLALSSNYFAMSVLPAGSYSTVWPQASRSAFGNVTSIATTNALGGAFVRMASTVEASYLRWRLGGAQYVGEQRILGVARAAAPASLYLMQGEEVPGEEFVNSTATVATTEWGLVDLGVVSVSSITLLAETTLTIHRGSQTTANALDLAGFVMLPESSTVWLNSAAKTRSAQFNGIANAVYSPAELASLEFETRPFVDSSSRARGAIPLVLPGGAEPPTIAFLLMPTAGHSLNSPVQAAVTLVPRTRYIF